MKKAFVSLILLLCITGCSGGQGFYGTYTFADTVYLSLLSSSTLDSMNERMAGTKFYVKRDVFKIEFPDKTVEVKSPVYVKKAISNDFPDLVDLRSIVGNQTRYQYTVCDKNGATAHWRLYVLPDSLLVASYADNTVNGSEIIMSIYKVTKSGNEAHNSLQTR